MSVFNFHKLPHSIILTSALAGFCFTPASQPEHLLFTYNYYQNEKLLDNKSTISFTDFDSIDIPLKRAGRLIMVEANVDGEIGNLIFDTGATGIVLNKTYFRDHLSIDNHTSKGITGSLDNADGVIIDHLIISDLSFKGISANMANLGHIENRRGIKILGLFGFSLLRGFEIIIDVNNGKLLLHKTNKKGDRINSKYIFKPDYMQKIRISQNIVFLKGIMGGKSLWFCLDSGAETNVISGYAPKEVLKTITINRKSNLNGTGSQINQVLFGIMNDFIFGNTRLSNMETIITNLDHLNEAYDVHINGILGYNFLVKGIICINFEKNQLGICFAKAADL